MHEMALVEGLFRIIEEQGRAQNFAHVRAVRLEIGRLATVEPDALRFCFEAISPGSIAAGARLDILSTPGTAFCFDCNAMIEINGRLDDCPHCGGGRLQVTGGDQMRLSELEVE